MLHISLKKYLAIKSVKILSICLEFSREIIHKNLCFYVLREFVFTEIVAFDMSIGNHNEQPQNKKSNCFQIFFKDSNQNIT